MRDASVDQLQNPALTFAEVEEHVDGHVVDSDDRVGRVIELQLAHLHFKELLPLVLQCVPLSVWLNPLFNFLESKPLELVVLHFLQIRQSHRFLLLRWQFVSVAVHCLE